MAIEVRKVVLEGVSDASGLRDLIVDGVFAADEVIAVIGKTEGNGGERLHPDPRRPGVPRGPHGTRLEDRRRGC